MKHFYDVKRKLPFFLLIGVLMICMAMLFINCGTGPQNKIVDPEGGAHAIDFSLAPGGQNGIVYVISDDLINRQSANVTVEAWVKRKTDNLNGFIFSRHAAEGVAMWVKDNEPKFALRRLVSGTSTDFVVESNIAISANSWNHIAGVLVSADHSAVHAACQAAEAGAESEVPHLDIYVAGDFKNCASTTTLTMSQDLLSNCSAISLGEGVCEVDTYAVGGQVSAQGICNVTNTDINSCADITTASLNGIIDEPRYWTTARTQAQIQACRNQELETFSSGDCGVQNSHLAGYMRFNEGEDSSPSDKTGLGSGSKEDNGVSVDSPLREWKGGWVDGAPIASRN